MPIDVLVCLAVLREEYGPGARVFFRKVLHYAPVLELVDASGITTRMEPPPAIYRWLRARRVLRNTVVDLDTLSLHSATMEAVQWQTHITTP